MLKYIFKWLHQVTCSHLSKRWILKEEKNIYNIYDVQCMNCGKIVFEDIRQIDDEKYYIKLTGKKVKAL